MQKFEAEMAALPPKLRRAQELRKKIMWARARQVGVSALGVGAWLLSGGRTPPASVGHAARAAAMEGNEIASMEKELASLPTEYSIRENREREIDTLCQALAEAILARDWPKRDGDA